jgi:GT2 family glycosyltransferase
MPIFRRVGYFDEYFYPFYFMDCDWKRRALLLGYGEHMEYTPQVVHGGSKTVTHVAGASDWLSGVFENTHNYYITKWGGEPMQEQYRWPFNDPTWDVTIDWCERHDPYPENRPAIVGLSAPFEVA